MIYFEKLQPAPTCLEIEKAKIDGDYKCGDVLIRLRNEFKNKCYICETKEPVSINVEHRVAHKGSKVLKFCWENLFWSCAHCNNIKLDKYDDVLDCTNLKENVESRLRYEYEALPYKEVAVYPLDSQPSTIHTAELIGKVFNGTTKLKTVQASNIRQLLLDEVSDFQQNLISFHRANDESNKEKYYENIKEHLHQASAYTSFKREILNGIPKLKTELADFSANLQETAA